MNRRPLSASARFDAACDAALFGGEPTRREGRAPDLAEALELTAAAIDLALHPPTRAMPPALVEAVIARMLAEMAAGPATG